ncbi:MAG: hypothetical protein IPN16_16620 [Gemmatimonadetes bacterium]|nr:hypothetical protein [Gemmatimonadota bacterium]
MPFDSSQVTHLLTRWKAGDLQARDALVPLVYERLRRLAHQRRRSVPGEHSLNTTALVHEAWLRLADAPQLDVPDRSSIPRAHGAGDAQPAHRSRAGAHGRQARERARGTAARRGDRGIGRAGGAADGAARRTRTPRVAQPRQGHIIEQRYFGGLTLEETADALGISLATVKRDLRSAQAWLALELQGQPVA